MAPPKANSDNITLETIKEIQKQFDLQQSSKPAPVTNPPATATANDFANRVLRAKNVTLLGGPFHYHVRSGTYGNPWDEIPWKVRFGMAEIKERHGYPENPYTCPYEPRVLLNNWVEDRRDRNFIKYCSSRISQYGHHYRSEYMRSFTKPVCNKQRDVLLNITTFPLMSHPVHQPELNTDTLRMSAPKPEGCVVDEQVAKCQKEMERQVRYYKASL